jgi:hypothetical protein
MSYFHCPAHFTTLVAARADCGMCYSTISHNTTNRTPLPIKIRENSLLCVIKAERLLMVQSRIIFYFSWFVLFLTRCLSFLRCPFYLYFVCPFSVFCLAAQHVLITFAFCDDTGMLCALIDATILTTTSSSSRVAIPIYHDAATSSAMNKIRANTRLLRQLYTTKITTNSQGWTTVFHDIFTQRMPARHQMQPFHTLCKLIETHPCVLFANLWHHDKVDSPFLRVRNTGKSNTKFRGRRFIDQPRKSTLVSINLLYFVFVTHIMSCDQSCTREKGKTKPFKASILLYLARLADSWFLALSLRRWVFSRGLVASLASNLAAK